MFECECGGCDMTATSCIQLKDDTEIQVCDSCALYLFDDIVRINKWR